MVYTTPFLGWICPQTDPAQHLVTADSNLHDLDDLDDPQLDRELPDVQIVHNDRLFHAKT